MRIRTIKPEFFTHEGLFELEKESGLPIRVAFAGLWCSADREGRFKWEPRRLGIAILPYDAIDFSRVLHALLTRAFILRYRVADAWFGAIPSWKKHQIVNNRESQSIIPDVSVADELDASGTRAPRVLHAGEGEGKGKEGKGRDLPPAKPAEGDEPDARHSQICGRWGELFKNAFATVYQFTGRDAKALQRFLTTCKDTAEEIITVAVQAWERAKQDRFAAFCKQASTIHGLCGAYNGIRVELQTPPNNATHKPGNTRGFQQQHDYSKVTDK